MSRNSNLSFFIIIFLLLVQTYSVYSQTIWRTKIVSGNHTELSLVNLQNCNINNICYFNSFTVNDLVVHPNGHIYLAGHDVLSNINELRVIDTCQFIKNIFIPNHIANINLGQNIKALCSDEEGQIFISLNAKNNIYKFDPLNETFTDLGILPNGIEVFDFTFRNGKLYASGLDAISSHIVEINLTDLSQSKVLFSDNNSAYFSKLITIPNINECKDAVTYISRWVDNDPEIGTLDFTDGSFARVCIVDEGNGMASPLEFLASDPECELLFDLDRDNSSGEYPYDFRNDGILCLDDKKTHTVDTDVFLHTAANLDSIIISLSGDMDGASEILTLGGSLPNASLTYRNGIYRLTLMGDRSDASWLAALRAIQYQNTSITPSAGLRTITFTAYNAIKSNQAKTFIRIGSHPYAGRDTSLVVCASMQIDNITQRLGGQSGGFWSPPLSVYNTYNSDTDLATTYYYIAESADCGLDTAVVRINRLPLRTLDLGPDVSLCRAESHLIAIPTIAGDQIRWQDGNTSINRSINIPGTYKVFITTSDGCIITDSITITRSYSKVEKTSTIDLCKGQPYDYHGKIYQSGATIVDSLNATTGCDTLLTIVLRPIPTPTISRDTTTCDDQPISIQGKTYQIGDTIIRSKPSAIGCDTLISLAYKKHTSSVNGVYLTDSLVCEGSKRVVIFESNHFADLIWSNGDSSKVADFGPGQHFVQAIDSLGCLRIIPFEIKAYPLVQYDIQTTDPMCLQANGSIKIINKNPDLSFTTVINGIETHQLTNLNAGNFNIIITDVNDCLTYDTLTLTDINDFDVSMPSNINGQIGQIISIAYQSTGGSIDTISFSPQSDIAWVTDSILVSIKDDRVYSITFVDENGCIVTKSLTIQARIPINTYILPDMVSIQSTNLENTLFYLKNEGITYDMSIYDRWGNLIYQVQSANGGDASQAWEPQKSKVVPGVYVYLINIDTIDGKIQKYGTVTVL